MIIVRTTVAKETKTLFLKYVRKRVCSNSRSKFASVDSTGKKFGGDTNISCRGLNEVETIQKNGKAVETARMMAHQYINCPRREKKWFLGVKFLPPF
jgi:hypothetical protein